MKLKWALRTLGLTAFLAGGVLMSLPADVTAATCTADSGASCSCAGGCEANHDYCWCKPPAV